MSCNIIRKITISIYGKSILRQDLKNIKIFIPDLKHKKVKPAIVFFAGFDNISGSGVSICERILSKLAQFETHSQVLLNFYDIFIFPSVNPDCEMLGNSLRNASGSELKIIPQFSKILQPELYYLHKALFNINRINEITFLFEIGSSLDKFFKNEQKSHNCEG